MQAGPRNPYVDLPLGSSATRPRLRWRIAALPAVAVLWLVLVLWCVNLIFTVTSLRSDVDDRVAWVFHAESMRRETMQLHTRAERKGAAAAPGLTFQLPTRIRSGLAAEELSAEAPVTNRTRARLELAAAEVLTTAGLLDGRAVSAQEGIKHRPLIRRLGRTVEKLDAALSDAALEVRHDLKGLSRHLDRKWYALYVLAAVSIAVLGALGLLLWRWRGEIMATGLKEAYLRTLVQSSRDLIWALDARGHWTFLNEAAQSIYGYTADDMVGAAFVEFASPDYLARDRKAFRLIMNGETVADYETVHVRRDGLHINLLFQATAMRNTRGEIVGMMGTATDMTNMRRMQTQLLRNERLQAVATLGGGIAHDFNNLLTVIIGQAEVAKAKGDLPAGVERRIDSILETAMRARKLTKQLIAFARRQPLQKEVVDLVAVVRQMGELTRQLAGEQVRIQEILPGEPVRIVGDWSQIEQVIINLVVNARDAVSEDGAVTVAVHRRSLAAGEAAPHGLQAGEWAVLEVSDNGEGIDPAILGRIFDPFFTTKEPGKGTGLGLATVHGVVHQHGGTVVTQTTPGNGTCMQVFLPLAPDGKPANRPAEPALATT